MKDRANEGVGMREGVRKEEEQKLWTLKRISESEFSEVGRFGVEVNPKVET